MEEWEVDAPRSFPYGTVENPRPRFPAQAGEPSESRGSLLWRFFSHGLGLHRVDSSLGALKFQRFFSAGPEALGLLEALP